MLKLNYGGHLGWVVAYTSLREIVAHRGLTVFNYGK